MTREGMPMEYSIEPLPRERWKGVRIPLAYTSECYYDIAVLPAEGGFDIPIRKKRFETPFTHVPEDGDYPDCLYADWWEKAEAYGIVDGDALLAAIEVCPEEWSNRLMVTELFVAPPLQGRGWGRRLMEMAQALTIQKGCRALMLETQSSNVNAVDFYRHMGFGLIGFDTCCYTNRDVQRREVRFNMGWFPAGNDGEA